MHKNRYDEAHLGEAVDGYAGGGMPGLRSREQQRSPELFGYAAFYGWSEDKARQATEPEGLSFSAYLRAHGFGME